MKSTIQIVSVGCWDRQPCMFGGYGQVLFWSDLYETSQISERLYALLMGRA